MTTPLIEHGGILPSKFHTIEYAHDNKVVLIIRLDKKLNAIPFMQIMSSCLLNQVEKIFFVFPKLKLLELNATPPNLNRFHPILQTIVSDENNDKILELLKSSPLISSQYSYFLDENSLIHPNFWKILKRANQNNYKFLDDKKNIHTLYCKDAIKTIELDVIGAYSDVYDDFNRIYDSIVCSLDKMSKSKVQEIVMDVSNNFTPLCRLAFSYGTDKSVYNIMTHRHPYTPIYHMFFNKYRNKQVKIGEIGILNGASMNMWNDYFYFPTKTIHGFDIDPTSLEKIKDIPNCKGFLVDSGNSSGLKLALKNGCLEDKELYDILIEDASHRLEHQLIFLRDAIHFVKPGGMLVIEDIFRDICPSRFEEVLELIDEYIDNAILIKPEHTFKHSPGWNNDQILIVFKSSF
jgi:hypothetical protein